LDELLALGLVCVTEVAELHAAVSKVAITIKDLNGEAWIIWEKTIFPPSSHSNVVLCGANIGILRNSCSVTSNILSVLAEPDIEPLNIPHALLYSLDLCPEISPESYRWSYAAAEPSAWMTG